LDPLLDLADRQGPPDKPPRGVGRRRPTRPLVEVARARSRQEATDALQRWLDRHPEVHRHLEDADVLVDGMRGRSSVWYRVRVNLEHVPEQDRPAQEPLEVDYDPWTNRSGGRP
jgi:bifunctional non-homologous end joining protein LigD